MVTAEVGLAESLRPLGQCLPVLWSHCKHLANVIVLGQILCRLYPWVFQIGCTSKGGLNLRQASLHAAAGYISSFHQSSDLMGRMLGHPPQPPPHLPSAVSSLALAANRPDWVHLSNINIDVPLRQRALSLVIDSASQQQLQDTAPDTRSQALALSTSLQHAGDWLNVVPSSALGLHLQDQEFRFCLKYWLGLPLYEDNVTCPVCARATDALGDHQIGCGGNGDLSPLVMSHD